MEKKTYIIHILSYLLKRDGFVTKESYENFTKNNFIRHTCATKINHCCCNPEHLSELSRTKEGFRQNAIDAVKYHKNSKLTKEDIAEIKELYLDSYFNNWNKTDICRHISSIYNVHRSTITNIINVP